MKHVVGFSDGADSQATALWVRERFPAGDILLTNVDPGGNEHPVTSEFIRQYSATVFPVTVITPIVADMAGRSPGKIAEMGLSPSDPLTFDLLASLKGRFPSTKARFCTTHLKLEPMRRWCYENGARGLNDNGRYGPDPHVEGILSGGYERYAGVRRDESASRADVDEREYDDLFACWLNRPIASWTKAQVFHYLGKAGEEVNPLYTMGFGRVGCAPCINAGKEDIRMWASRFPEMIAKVRAWEATVGRTFFPPCMPPLVKGGKRRHGSVDEVVEWAKTVHGGDQYALPLLEADIQSGMCMSKYGLCE